MYADYACLRVTGLQLQRGISMRSDTWCGMGIIAWLFSKLVRAAAYRHTRAISQPYAINVNHSHGLSLLGFRLC